MLNITPPSLSGTPQDQLIQLKSWIFRFLEELNITLDSGTLGGSNTVIDNSNQINEIYASLKNTIGEVERDLSAEIKTNQIKVKGTGTDEVTLTYENVTQLLALLNTPEEPPTNTETE